MREIVIDDNYLSRLNKLEPELHSESNLYYNDRTLFKVFTCEDISSKSFISYLNKKEKKIELLSSLKDIPHVILPQDKLVKMNGRRKLFAGLTMEYIDSSVTLYEASRCLDLKVLFNLLRRISVTLKKIHKRSEGIVIGDCSFYNILVTEIDSILEYFFIDFDGVLIGKEFKNDRIAFLTKEYSRYRNARLKINKNYDRLTFLLYFLEMIFDKTITEVSMYQYDEMSEKVGVLKDLRSLVLELKKVEGTVPEVPYLHEVISAPRESLRLVS